MPPGDATDWARCQSLVSSATEARSMASALNNILQRPQPPPGTRPQTVRGEGLSPPGDATDWVRRQSLVSSATEARSMASALNNILQRPQPPPGARPQTVRGEGLSPPSILRRGSMSLSAVPGAPGSERSRSMSFSAGPGAPGARPLTARPRFSSSANVLENVSQASQQSAGPLADAGRLSSCSSPKRPPVMEPSRRGSFKLSSAGAGGGIPPQLPLQVATAAMSSQDMDQSAGPLADAGHLERLSSRSCSPKRPPVMEPSRRGSFKLSSAGAGGGIPPQLPLQVATAAMSSQDMDQSAGPLAGEIVIHGDALASRLAFKLQQVGDQFASMAPKARARHAEPQGTGSKNSRPHGADSADAGHLERLSSRSCSPKRPPVMEPSRRGSFKLSSAGAGGGIPPQLPLQVATAAMPSDQFSSFAQSHYPHKYKAQVQLRTAVAFGNTLDPQDGALDCRSHTVPKSSGGRDVVNAAGIDDKQRFANQQRDNLDVASCPEKERLVALTHQGKHAKSFTAKLSTSKRGSLFRRQSVADIFAEARAKDQLHERERKEHADTVQVAANRQNNDWRRIDDTKLISEQQLRAAASSAAAERIGRIVLSRTRSRSTSPKRTPLAAACGGGGRDDSASMERQHDNDGDSSRALLLKRRGSLNGNSSPFATGRTPSADDAALDDVNNLDRIAQSDEEYRRQRSLIRKALREFRPSEDDWVDPFETNEKGGDAAEDEPLVCDRCEQVAVQHCKNCNTLLCELCSQLHLQKHAFVDHTLAPATEYVGKENDREGRKAAKERLLKPPNIDEAPSPLPENPAEAPGWAFVRTPWGSKKWYHFAKTDPVSEVTSLRKRLTS